MNVPFICCGNDNEIYDINDINFVTVLACFIIINHKSF